MTIQEIQDNARSLCQQQGWTDHNPSQRFRYLISEVGELSKELTRLEWNPADLLPYRIFVLKKALLTRMSERQAKSKENR